MLNGGFSVAEVQAFAIERNELQAQFDTVTAHVDSMAENNLIEYYTFAGTSLMGLLSFDVQKIFPMDMLSEGDLRMFIEVDLLGVKNYPIFFEDKTERMPIIMGINLPTFKVLDVLSFEYEIFNESGELLTIGSTRLVFISAKTMKPINAPEELIEKIKLKINASTDHTIK